MSYRFDVEQLVAKDGKLLVSRNGRHFLLSGLPTSDLDQLVDAFAYSNSIGSDKLHDTTLRIFIDQQFLKYTDLATFCGDKSERHGRQPDFAYRIANPIRALGSALGLVVLLVISIAPYFLTSRHLDQVNIAGLIATAPASQSILAIVTLLISSAVHELGHAAASCYYTGTVGKVRLRLIWGIPAVTVDVTSFCLTERTGKIAISAAGGAFQAAFSVCLLVAIDVQGIQAGATMGIFLAAFNLLPLPHYDGYWLLVDMIGRRLKPRLIGSAQWPDICYGALLLALYVTALPATMHTIAAQSAIAMSMLDTGPIRACILLTFSLIAIVTTGIFSLTLFRTLFAKT